MYVIDLEGNEYELEATSTNEGELNSNQTFEATILPTKNNNKFINDIQEMWRVVDHDGTEHRIVYAKRKGKASYREDVPTRKVDETYYIHSGQTVEETKTIKGKDYHQLTVDIKAAPLFFDELDTLRMYEDIDRHMTAMDAFTLIFENTNFGFTLVDNFSAVGWEGFGKGGDETKLETFKRALDRYKAEFRIVGNTVYLEEQIGRDTQFQYRHRLNASNIEQEIDAEALYTYVQGFADYGDEGGGEEEGGGQEDWEDAKLTGEYTSPLAKILGKRHAPPVKNGNITKKSKLDEEMKAKVEESLQVSVSADVYDLRKQGYPLAQSELGDRVFLVDGRIGLNEEVRVVSQTITRDWKGNVLDLNITFGSE